MMFSITTGAVSLTQGGTKTLAVVIPPATGSAYALAQVSVSFDGSPAVQNNAIRVDLIATTVTTAGTAASVTVQPYWAGQAAQCSGSVAFTTEPSLVVLDSWYVNPSSGLFVLQWPLGREPRIIPVAAPTNRVGLRVVTPATMTTINGNASLAWDE